MVEGVGGDDVDDAGVVDLVGVRDFDGRERCGERPVGRGSVLDGKDKRLGVIPSSPDLGTVVVVVVPSPCCRRLFGSGSGGGGSLSPARGGTGNGGDGGFPGKGCCGGWRV